MKILNRYPARIDKSVPNEDRVADKSCQQKTVSDPMKRLLLREQVRKVASRAEHIKQNSYDNHHFHGCHRRSVG